MEVIIINCNYIVAKGWIKISSGMVLCECVCLCERMCTIGMSLSEPYLVSTALVCLFILCVSFGPRRAPYKSFHGPFGRN